LTTAEIDQPGERGAALLDAAELAVTRDALLSSEARLRALARHVPGAVYLREIGGQGAFRYLSENIEQLTGVPARRFYDGRARLFELMEPAEAMRVAGEMQSAVERGRPFELIYRLRHAHGAWRYVEDRGQAVADSSGERHLVGVMTDVTARKLAGDVLHDARDDLERRVAERTRQLQQANDDLRREREFLLATLEQHEQARQLISYEIHDGVAQYITGALLRLEAHAQTCSNPDQSSVDPELEIGLGLLRKSLEEARRLIGGLRPPILDERGLVAAVEYLISGSPDLPKGIEFSHEVQFDRLPPLWESNVFRIVQEALTNVAKHSQARHGRVQLLEDGGMLRLSVIDDGQGFEADGDNGSRHGLAGIRHRARLLGGAARIVSYPGDGTRVEVDVPLPAKSEERSAGVTTTT
jgi:PAS domain S-box-containing protein